MAYHKARYRGDRNQVTNLGGSVSGLAVGKNARVFHDLDSMPAHQFETPRGNFNDATGNHIHPNDSTEQGVYGHSEQYGGDRNQVTNNRGNMSKMAIGENAQVVHDLDSMPAHQFETPGGNFNDATGNHNHANDSTEQGAYGHSESYGGDHNDLTNDGGRMEAIAVGKGATVAQEPNSIGYSNAPEITLQTGAIIADTSPEEVGGKKKNIIIIKVIKFPKYLLKFFRKPPKELSWRNIDAPKGATNTTMDNRVRGGYLVREEVGSDKPR